MKHVLVFISLSFVLALPAAEPVITQRGPHHRVWQWTEQKVWPDGQTHSEDHQLVELATGLNFFHNGQWEETKEEITLLPDGSGAAMHGPHAVVFAANLNSRGAIDLFMPDGKRMTSHILALAYNDGTKAVLLATVKDSTGELHPPRQILYPDAFASEYAIHAAVR